MEERDLDLIKENMHNDQALKSLFDEHVDFERKLEKFNSKPYLTPAEEVERKNLQKRKLRGRDMIEDILVKYRSSDRSN